MAVRDIPEELVSYIRAKAEKSGYRMVSLSSVGKGMSLIEIVLDKENGITLDECARFNRGIVSWIDENGVLPGNYRLDVCSPGLDRELKDDEDFQWASDKKVCVMTREPIDGKTEILGVLSGFSDNGEIAVREDGGNVVRIERGKITRAKLHVDTKKKAT